MLFNTAPRLRLSIPSGLFPLGFHTKFLYSSLIYPCMMFIPSISFSLICQPNKIWWRVNLIKLLIMHFSLASFYFLPLRHKYSLIKTRVPRSERCQTSHLFGISRCLRRICHRCQQRRTKWYLLSLLGS